MANAIATHFYVRTVENYCDYPKVIVKAEVSVIASKSIVAKIDNAKIREAVEKSVSESCTLQGAK